MSLSVNNVQNTVSSLPLCLSPNQAVSFKANNIETVDTVDITKKELSIEDKQKLIKKARTTAAGWSIFGSVGSTIYYAVRSDKTIAKKYNLDIQKDKTLIKRIRKEQVTWTLPGLFVGAGPVLAYLGSQNLSHKNIEVD